MEFKTYQQKPVIVQAVQWFRNGDHPLDYAKDREGYEGGTLRTWTAAECKALGWEGAVVRYYRRPDVSGTSICEACNHTMHDHGWIDAAPTKNLVVCPGDYVVTDETGDTFPLRPAFFNAMYNEVVPVSQGTVTQIKVATNRSLDVFSLIAAMDPTFDPTDTITKAVIDGVYDDDQKSLLESPLELDLKGTEGSISKETLHTQGELNIAAMIDPQRAVIQIVTSGQLATYALVSITRDNANHRPA